MLWSCASRKDENAGKKPYWIPTRNKDGMTRHEEEVNHAKTNLSDQLYFEKDLDETKQLFGALKMM